MANELAEATTKTITNKLIDSIIESVPEGRAGETAAEWWEENRASLIGLSIAEVSTIIRNAKRRKTLAAKYDTLVASMSWSERIQFLKGGIEELRISNSKKIRTAALIAKLIELTPKILTIVMMVV